LKEFEEEEEEEEEENNNNASYGHDTILAKLHVLKHGALTVYRSWFQFLGQSCCCERAIQEVADLKKWPISSSIT